MLFVDCFLQVTKLWQKVFLTLTYPVINAGNQRESICRKSGRDRRLSWKIQTLSPSSIKTNSTLTPWLNERFSMIFEIFGKFSLTQIGYYFHPKTMGKMQHFCVRRMVSMGWSRWLMSKKGRHILKPTNICLKDQSSNFLFGRTEKSPNYVSMYSYLFNRYELATIAVLRGTWFWSMLRKCTVDCEIDFSFHIDHLTWRCCGAAV